MTIATTHYKLLDTNDGVMYAAKAEPMYPAATSYNNKEYPGKRRQVLETSGPPTGSVLVKTGGNALMAVDRTMVDQSNIISAVVPYGKRPGDTILVKCPQSDRLISTVIPDGIGVGQVFFVQALPPLEKNFSIFNQQPTECGGEDKNAYNLKFAAEN